jgi:hypothetical protein
MGGFYAHVTDLLPLTRAVENGDETRWSRSANALTERCALASLRWRLDAARSSPLSMARHK